VFELFRDVNPVMNRFDLWKATSAWWFLEGEAFWFFGELQSRNTLEIFVLNTWKMRAWAENSVVLRWFYSTDTGEVPILPDEIIHFKEWSP